MNAGLAQFRSGKPPSPQHAVMHHDSPAYPRSHRQAHQAGHAAPGAHLPFRISHAVGVIIQHDGEAQGLLHHLFHRNFPIPDPHIGKLVKHSPLVITPSRHSHAHHTGGGELSAQGAGGRNHGINDCLRAFEHGSRIRSPAVTPILMLVPPKSTAKAQGSEKLIVHTYATHSPEST